MIVDDSAVARAVLSRMIESDGAFEIVAVASSAEEALDALKIVQVDIVLLDLEMPGAGGLKSIPQIVLSARGARVMIVSSLAEEGARATVEALAMGAADALPKPGAGRFNGRFSEILLSRLKALAGTGGSPDKAPPAEFDSSHLRAMGCERPKIIAIGASTGGIHALNAFFAALPAVTGNPILVTQHLPVPFMAVFTRQLAIAARRVARVAVDDMVLVPDEIIVAPGDAHLTVRRDGDRDLVRLDRRAAASGCMPSLDPMFESVGRLFGPGAIAVVLSGMGRDGTAGAAVLVERGGSVLAQDASTSAVWGMPKSILDARLACAILPPELIARRIASRNPEASCK